MSNIDKQALLVSKAKASVFTMGYISQFEASDIDSDDIDLRFEVDAVETGTTVSIVDECGHAAQIITALLDELEKAQRANVAQDDHINQQQAALSNWRKVTKKPLSKSIPGVDWRSRISLSVERIFLSWRLLVSA
ncbi:hypothetical protein WI235_19220 [Salmonella enterica subsp. enterica serovar Infantis]